MRLPNGWGTVYNLGGKRRRPFVAKKTIGWRDDGKPIYQIIGYFEQRPEAITALVDFNKNPYDINSKKITVKELYTKWFNEKKKRISPSMVNCYEFAFKKIESLWNMHFLDMRVIHMQSVIDELDDMWTTKSHIKVLFNQLYKYAGANDLCDKNYAVYIALGEKKEKIIREPFTEKDIDILWDNVDNIENADLLLIYIYTGFRPKELLIINKDDINLEGEYIRGGLKTKAGKNRLVPIHHRIMPLVRKRMKLDCKYLITTKIGNKMLYRYYNDVFHEIIDKLNLGKHSPHDTRHTFATLLDNVGANKVSIQRLLGHASRDVTNKVYTHKDINELRTAIELLH